MDPTGRRSARQGTRERRRDLLRDAQDFMAREMARTLSLGEVAAQVAASPRQLQRVFAGAGTTYRERLRDLRMQRAAEMLRSGGSVDDVASAVGYASTRAFTRAFTSVVGTDPGLQEASPR